MLNHRQNKVWEIVVKYSNWKMEKKVQSYDEGREMGSGETMMKFQGKNNIFPIQQRFSAIISKL